MNRYETYKDSGISWLGEVPDHWDTMSLKYICDVRDGTHDTPQYVYESDNSYPLVTSKDISNGNINFESAKFISEEDYLNISKRSNVNFGDLLMPMIGTVGGSVLVETYRKFTIKNVALFKAGQFCAKWLKYFLDSELSKIQFELEKNGGVQDFVGLTTLRNLIILKLPLKEQTAIAHYLDTKLGEIDALIGKQQTLLEKLAEQRTAVITHAVTKGLNPAAPMKNSGVEWLGNVPAHWETWKITHAIDLIGSGTTPKSDNAEYYDGDVLWVTTSELRENFISDTKQKVSNSAIKEYSALKIYPVNSVAMAMYGATIGRLGILEREATFNQACCVFGNSKILHYKFLFYWLWHRRPILISLSNGGGQPNLSQDDLRKLKIPIPSYEEQAAIADYLDQETAKIDRLCDTVNQTIGCLKEYRTALITQAVTGKIKVTDK